MNTKLFIKNASIITPSKMMVGNVLLENGKIVSIGKMEQPKESILIDAEYNYLLPGGIDVHVHLDLKTPNGTTADDFESGSKAALAGGTTSIIDFITPGRKQNLQKAFEERKSQIKEIYTDYSFHQSITHWDKDTAKQMENAVKHQGITSFKTYLTYSAFIGIDLMTLENVMQKAAELNALVLVHAEEGKLNDKLADEFLDSKKSLGFIHKITHPVVSEVQAIQEVIKLTQKTNCKTYIVHVSTSGGIKAISKAKKKGLPIYAETCPQYFVLHDIVYNNKGDRKSIENILSPPIRPINHKLQIAQSVAHGEFDCISTDHCSFTWNDKYPASKKYKDIPHGIGGVQYRLLLSHHALVASGLITWNEMAKLTAENPAKLFGLKNKGKIEIGYDADLVLIKNLTKKIKVRSLKDYSKSDINVFENKNVFAVIDKVIKAGQVVFENEKIVENLPQGRFIKRK